jgi:hypothetical protein
MSTYSGMVDVLNACGSVAFTAIAQLVSHPSGTLEGWNGTLSLDRLHLTTATRKARSGEPAMLRVSDGRTGVFTFDPKVQVTDGLVRVQGSGPRPFD